MGKLRGQLIDKPKEQMWMLKSESDLEEYKYTCEPGHMEWTPLNSNLTMQGIKVQVNRPIPETTISNLANSHEDTLLLLDLMRHKRQQEGQKKRVANEVADMEVDKVAYPGKHDSRDGAATEKEERAGEV